MFARLWEREFVPYILVLENFSSDKPAFLQIMFFKKLYVKVRGFNRIFLCSSGI